MLDRVLYTNKSLDKYYLYANEYAFDPGELIDKIMDKLLDKIQINFSNLDDDWIFFIIFYNLFIFININIYKYMKYKWNI